MLDNPTPSVPAHKVSDYKLSDYRVKLNSKILVQTNQHPLKPVGLWNVSLLGVRLSSIQCIYKFGVKMIVVMKMTILFKMMLNKTCT